MPAEDARGTRRTCRWSFREAHDIPYQTMGIAPPAPTSVREAIEHPPRPPARTILARRSPCACWSTRLRRRQRSPEVDPQRWTAWCDGLGIVHGADRSDHAGTYIEGDILNWDQGLRRLALGAFMIGDGGGTVGEEGGARVSPFLLGSDAYAPFTVTTAELREAAAFGVLARSLIEDARFARAREMTTAEWAEFIGTMVSTYVTPVGPEEAEELTRHLRRIQRVGDADLSGRRVSYRIAYDPGDAAPGVRPGRERVGGGRRFDHRGRCAPSSMPLRVVFACGMGEGRFPSAAAEVIRSTFAGARRREGDVSARDRDKYAFLELLLGARDRLALSYVSRDPLTGDPLAPASVVQELLGHTLSQGYVSDVSAVRHRHPLRRWDPEVHPRIFGREAATFEPVALPEARAEARTLAMRRAMQADHPDVHEVRARAEANEPGWQKLAEHLRLAPMPRAPRDWRETKIVVPMHALVKFLEFPLHGWAKFRFGLGELEDEDVLARESEPFETELRDETLFLRGVLLAAKRRGVPLEQAYDQAVRDRELRGAGPSGAFARGERRDHVETLRTWRAELSEHEVALESLDVHRFGRGGEHAESDEVHEALSFELDVLDGETKRVLQGQIIGRTLPLSREGASVTFAKRVDDTDDDWARATRRRTLLRSLVDHAVLCASQGQAAERTSLIVVATPEGPKTERIRLPPWTRDKALLWLRGLVRDLLGAKHDYFLPYEAAFVHRERSEGGPIATVLEEARDKLRDGRQPLALRSAYGPVPRPQGVPDPGRGGGSQDGDPALLRRPSSRDGHRDHAHASQAGGGAPGGLRLRPPTRGHRSFSGHAGKTFTLEHLVVELVLSGRAHRSDPGRDLHGEGDDRAAPAGAGEARGARRGTTRLQLRRSVVDTRWGRRGRVADHRRGGLAQSWSARCTATTGRRSRRFTRSASGSSATTPSRAGVSSRRSRWTGATPLRACSGTSCARTSRGTPDEPSGSKPPWRTGGPSLASRICSGGA